MPNHGHDIAWTDPHGAPDNAFCRRCGKVDHEADWNEPCRAGKPLTRAERERDALKQRVAELERERDAIDKELRGNVCDPDPLKPMFYGSVSHTTTYGLVAGIRRERDALRAQLATLRKVASCLHDFATAHERWEAALIMDDAAWQGGMAALPTLTETLYAGMMELQRQRAAALVTYDLAAYRATKEPSDEKAE